MILANNDIFEYRSDKKSRHASQPEMARIGKLISLFNGGADVPYIRVVASVLVSHVVRLIGQ